MGRICETGITDVKIRQRGSDYILFQQLINKIHRFKNETDFPFPVNVCIKIST